MGSISSNEAFITLVICCKFQKTALNSDFKQGGGGGDNSYGVNFEHHGKLLSLSSSAVSFRRTDLNSGRV